MIARLHYVIMTLANFSISLAIAEIAVAADRVSSFNCATRTLGVDYVICSDRALLQAEEALAQIYREALKTVSDKQQLRNGQRYWAKQFGLGCGLPMRGEPSSPLKLEARRCVQEALSKRVAFLQAIVSTKQKDNTSPTPSELRNKTSEQGKRNIQLCEGNADLQADSVNVDKGRLNATALPAPSPQATNSNQNIPRQEPVEKVAQDDGGTWIFWLLGILGFGSIVNSILSNKCPSCGKYFSISVINEKVNNKRRKFVGYSTTLHNNKQKTRQRRVTTEYITEECRCENCGHEFSRKVTRSYDSYVISRLLF